MLIPDLYRRNQLTISFEFFPPKTEEAERVLFEETLPKLKTLNPAFISVTYGAGGGTRTQTLRIVNRIRKEFAIEAVAHFTCVGSTRQVIADFLKEVEDLGIENILALRGDPPKGQESFQAVEGGFSYAVDLIRFIRERSRVSIGAAGYPEGHVECNDKILDWDRTAAKVKAGAQFLITQLFYDNAAFFAFEKYLREKHQVEVPIIPGILPFLGVEQVKRFTSMCGSKIPPDLLRRLEACANDEEARQVGVSHCAAQCKDLISRGVKGIHIYCLNRFQSTAELLQQIRA
ncbi:MAG: methylenetetrahydrofolate reductase [NAD(P)H] [Gemmataceae bacterium]|nr:methylenetetrahydrofolate reductase [NAD(P)H] [Gemmataceae bacterium]